MSRPSLTVHISPEDFQAFYWLKEELLAFCRAEKLSTAGSKQELAGRIHAYLLKKPDSPAARQVRKARGSMPETFTRDTVIGPGFRCSQALRAFFEMEIGPAFHFNGVMRDFIQNGQGKTLGQAVEVWRQDQQAPKVHREIDSQFEYNRHMRQFFAANPGKTLQDAIAAWKEKKSLRKEDR